DSYAARLAPDRPIQSFSCSYSSSSSYAYSFSSHVLASMHHSSFSGSVMNAMIKYARGSNAPNRTTSATHQTPRGAFPKTRAPQGAAAQAATRARSVQSRLAQNPPDARAKGAGAPM